MKQAYDTVKLRLTWMGNPCEQPEEGDELVTGTGRRYQILSINGKKHQCLVLPPDAEVQGKQFKFIWDNRNSRRAR